MIRAETDAARDQTIATYPPVRRVAAFVGHGERPGDRRRLGVRERPRGRQARRRRADDAARMYPTRIPASAFHAISAGAVASYVVGTASNVGLPASRSSIRIAALTVAIGSAGFTTST